MYSVIEIGKKNIHLIDEFLSGCEKSLETFRYFDSRDIYTAVSRHESTIVLKRKNKIIGYAHLDNEGDKTWLGICVVDDCIGKGFGKVLMTEILNRAKTKVITLTVDNDNLTAINLYKKFGFLEKKYINNIILMEKL